MSTHIFSLSFLQVLVEEPNHHWVEEVEQRFPSLDTPLLVCCTDGTQLSIDAMLLLKEAGYRSIVGLRCAGENRLNF